MKLSQKQRISTTFNELLQCLKSIDSNLAIERIPEKVLLLMGETKAGKTTLLYYLLKKKLVLKQNQEMGIMQMKPQALYLNAQIGNGYDSTTVYPNIPTDIGEDGCLIIDMPGFNDTRPMYRFLNIYIIKSVVKKIKSLHVSFVIPFQSLEGDALLEALENSCPLLSKDFLRAQHSFSFILTKIQDAQSDQDIFRQQMQQLKEDYSESKVAQVLDTFQQRKTYIFCNSQPALNQGANLKKQIVSQNKFYGNQKGMGSLLAEDYANIIMGKGSLQQFKQFLQQTLEQLTFFYPQLIKTFTQIVKYQHKELLLQCGIDFCDQLYNRLQSLEKMNFPVIDTYRRIRQQLKFNDMQSNLRNFVLKMKRSVTHTGTGNQNQKILQDLKCFVDYSLRLFSQFCGISEQLREAIHLRLKACFTMLQTLITIGPQAEIQQQLESFFKSENLRGAISSYFQLIEDQSFREKAMQMPQAINLIATNDQFREIVCFYSPKYGQLSTQTAIVQVQEPTKNKIIKHSFATTIVQQSKTLTTAMIRQTYISQLNLKSQQLEVIFRQVQKLPCNHKSVALLLKTIFQLKNESLKSAKQAKFISCLLMKTIKILSLLHLIEQAVTFAMCIPDLNQIQRLIQVGINFSEISPGFIKSVLLPYFLHIEQEFQMVQKLHSYLILREESIQELYKNEKEFVKGLLQMRQTFREEQNDYERKRFNFQLIQALIEGQGLAELLNSVEERCEKIAKSVLTTSIAQKQLLSLKNIV